MDDRRRYLIVASSSRCSFGAEVPRHLPLIPQNRILGNFAVDHVFSAPADQLKQATIGPNPREDLFWRLET